jgi:hypothetical protein
VKYAQCGKIKVVSEVCAVSEVLCSVSDGHYPESDNFSFSVEEKRRRTHATCVSYLRRRETRPRNTHLISEEKVDAPTQCTSRISGTRVTLLLNYIKKTANR